MKVKEQNVPVLRFPGFCGEWERSKIKELASLARGKFTPRPRNDPSYYGGDIPFVQTGDVVHSKGIISSYSKTLNEKGLKVSKLFPKGTILITIAANIGYSGILQIDMACPDSLVGIQCKKKINNYFLNIFLSTKQRYLDYLAPKGAQKNINVDFLAPYQIPYPPLPEQQKIAAFLTAVDSKIEQLSKKKALLEQYKKGMMQKLFSQELRFKDDQGNEFPDWEVKRLGDVATFSKGKGISKADISRDGVLECIRYGQLYTDYTETIRNVKSRTNIPAKKVVLSEPNDIIIPASGETQIDIATASCVLKGGVALGGDLNIIKTKYDGVFLSYYLNSNKKYDIAKLAQGISVVHLYAAQLKLLHLNLPSIPEQNKIATFLSSIDKKINLISTELTHAQAFKKALLQQMFA